jgi:hypothetical protein
MMSSIPPRLRAPVYMLVVGAIAIAVAASAYGWVVVPVVGPALLVIVAWYYMAGGRDNDYGAMLRRQSDERQAYRWLKMQALTGQVMSISAGIGYLVAIAAKATLWPFGVALGLVAVSQLAGWLVYREHPGPGGQQVGH